jgi:hypothetical protein
MVTPPEGNDRDVVEAAGAACVVVLGAFLGYVVAIRPGPPPPDPVAVTTVRITEVGRPVGPVVRDRAQRPR